MEYLPLGDTSPSSAQIARMVLALLGGACRVSHNPPRPPYLGLVLTDVMGQALTACRVVVRLADVQYGNGEAGTQVVTNPASPARGRVQISDDGSIRWECFFAAPGRSVGGLTSRTIAQTIIIVLAHRRIAKREETADGRPGGRTSLTAGDWSHPISVRTTFTTTSADPVTQTRPGVQESW